MADPKTPLPETPHPHQQPPNHRPLLPNPLQNDHLLMESNLFYIHGRGFNKVDLHLD